MPQGRVYRFQISRDELDNVTFKSWRGLTHVAKARFVALVSTYFYTFDGFELLM